MRKTEYRLKFCLKPKRTTRVIEKLFDLQDPVVISDTYYDSEKLDLRENGLQLRIRSENGELLQSIISEKGNLGFERKEHKKRLNQDCPDISAFEEMSNKTFQAFGNLDLVPIFKTEFARLKQFRDHPQSNDSQIELRFDKGQIRSGNKAISICEIELVLVRGEVSDLFASGLDIADEFSLPINLDNKSDRGYRLYTDDIPQYWKPVKLGLRRDISLESAIVLCLRDGFTHFLKNHNAFMETGDAEAIHQMRVGLRRFRSVIFAFKKVMNLTTTSSLLGQIKSLFKALGKIREIDVFLSEILPKTQDLLKHDQKDVLTKTLLAERNRLSHNLKTKLKAPTFTHFVLELGDWIESQQWILDDCSTEYSWYQRPLSEYAKMRLSKLHKKLVDQVLQQKHSDFSKWHQLRLLTKKLRYSCEFFSNQFKQGSSKPYIRSLSNWQDRLGRMNDLVSAASLVTKLSALAPQKDEAMIKEITLTFRGWCIALSQVESKNLVSQWRQFEQSDVFW